MSARQKPVGAIVWARTPCLKRRNLSIKYSVGKLGFGWQPDALIIFVTNKVIQ